MAAAPATMVGQTLGNHRLERLVGEGPVGAVFEAVHLPSSAKVRLKLIDTGLVEGDEVLVESASQLIVGSTGLHDSLPELMEVALGVAGARMVSVRWLEGQTLRQRLNQGPLTETEAGAIVVGVLEALDALHSGGLAHRDLKPENVLIAPEGSQPAIHLLDVGPSLISARSRFGAHYRSPEQARGGERVGAASDIYSCGALLYEALSGRKPFEASDFDVLMSQISLRRVTPLSEHRPDLAPGLLQIVDRAMAPVPTERYGEALEMLRDLRRTQVAAQQQRPSMPAAQQSLPQPAAQQSLPQPAAAPPIGGQGGMLSAPGLPPPPARPPEQEDFFHFEVQDEVPRLHSLPVAPGVAEAPEAPERQAGGGGGKKVAALLFLVLALGAGGTLIYLTFGAAQERQELSAQFDTAQADAGPAKVQLEKSRGTIRVKLNGMPQGARWFVDGRRLGANPFRAPRNPMVHKIRVEAPGHENFEAEVSFGEDQEIAVEMTPEGDSEPTPRGFKAYTRGFGANQHPIKRDRRPGPDKQSERFSSEKAPDQLRKRN